MRFKLLGISIALVLLKNLSHFTRIYHFKQFKNGGFRSIIYDKFIPYFRFVRGHRQGGATPVHFYYKVFLHFNKDIYAIFGI
jgi:hypothetical protein